MEGTTFDVLARRIGPSTRSRRGLLRRGLGGGLGVVIFGQVAEETLACRRNGKPCGSRRNGGCCSGTFKRGKCRPTPDAAGCTVNGADYCENQFSICPQNPNGVCARLDNGKPFCVEGFGCQTCTADANCTAYPNGNCLKTCPRCSSTDGQACVYPRAQT